MQKQKKTEEETLKTKTETEKTNKDRKRNILFFGAKDLDSVSRLWSRATSTAKPHAQISP